MTHTYQLILMDAEMAKQNWDPWTYLGMPIPSFDVRNGFNTREVKKAYRNMAKLYHPDKVSKMNLSSVS